MITITFDDAVNAENFELFSSRRNPPLTKYVVVPYVQRKCLLHFLLLLSEIFSNEKKNPNGCPARGTFYVSHQYTNYRDVQYLWNVGHEIAAHSVT